MDVFSPDDESIMHHCKYKVLRMYALTSYSCLPMSVGSSRPARVIRVAGVGGLGVHGNAFLPQRLAEGVLYVARLGGGRVYQELVGVFVW